MEKFRWTDIDPGGIEKYTMCAAMCRNNLKISNQGNNFTVHSLNWSWLRFSRPFGIVRFLQAKSTRLEHVNLQHKAIQTFYVLFGRGKDDSWKFEIVLIVLRLVEGSLKAEQATSVVRVQIHNVPCSIRLLCRKNGLRVLDTMICIARVHCY